MFVTWECNMRTFQLLLNLRRPPQDAHSRTAPRNAFSHLYTRAKHSLGVRTLVVKMVNHGVPQKQPWKAIKSKIKNGAIVKKTPHVQVCKMFPLYLIQYLNIFLINQIWITNVAMCTFIYSRKLLPSKM